MGNRKNQLPKVNIKRGDKVKVIAGNDKGSTGRVLAVRPKEGRALVENVKMISKHVKPNQQDQQGGIRKQEGPVDLSNLMVLEPKTGEPTRVGRRRNDDNKLVRYSKKTGEDID
jgi:large subunit ribosomal protein L24